MAISPFCNGCGQLVINNPLERVVGHESFWQLDVSVRSLMEALQVLLPL